MLPTEGLALLRGVAMEPREDARRLILADWMEETGRQDRADFVRAQMTAADETVPPLDRGKALARVDDLKVKVAREILADEVPLGVGVLFRIPEVAVYLTPDTSCGSVEIRTTRQPGEEVMRLSIRRGVVERFSAPWGWLVHQRTHGAVKFLTDMHPCVLSAHDRSPTRPNLGEPRETFWAWGRSARNRLDVLYTLPPDLFDRLDGFCAGGLSRAWKRYPTKGDAVRALERALLALVSGTEVPAPYRQTVAL